MDSPTSQPHQTQSPFVAQGLSPPANPEPRHILSTDESAAAGPNCVSVSGDRDSDDKAAYLIPITSIPGLLNAFEEPALGKDEGTRSKLFGNSSVYEATKPTPGYGSEVSASGSHAALVQASGAFLSFDIQEQDGHRAGTKRPARITEELHELVDVSSRPGHHSDQYSAAQAMAAIKDPGVTVSEWDRHPEPSVITDLGNRMYATRIQRVGQRTASRGTSPGPLNEKLYRVMREVPGLPGQFCPNTEVLRLVNEESIIEELKRHQDSLQLKKKSSLKSSQGSYRRLLSLPNRAIKASKSFGSGIRTLTGERSSDRIASQARQICGSQPAGDTGDSSSGLRQPTFRKIFAILVMIEMPLKIKRFLKDGVCDEDLPLTGRWVGGQFKLFRRKPSDRLSTERATLEKPLSCFRGWKSVHRERFEKTHWAMVAPFFGRGELGDLRPVRHYRLQPQVVLPFTLWEPLGIGGAFGQIFKTEIHRGHHSFYTSEGQAKYFAVKQLYSKSKTDFDNEVTVLKLLSAVNHPHLISLLTTFEKNETYHLVFHWGESDLLSYWRDSNPRPAVNSNTTLWLARQCAGIADGLFCIHKPHDVTRRSPLRHLDSFTAQLKLEESSQNHAKSPSEVDLIGHHGDIKAQNILLFHDPVVEADEWTLKISDFGQAGFRSGWDRNTANTPTYAPPEFAIPGAVIKHSSCDIWALGCLYLEFIAWFFGGWELLEDFANRRRSDDCRGIDTFYATKIDEETCAIRIETKSSVLEFIRELQDYPVCDNYFHDFLNMIQNHMLIVELDGQGQVQNHRYDCGQVAKSLSQGHRDTKKTRLL